MATPFTLAMLGAETAVERRRLQDQMESGSAASQGLDQRQEERQEAPASRPVRPPRNRSTSYFNSFQTICSSATDSPPGYVVAARQRPPQRAPHDYFEPLPAYSCTVEKAGKALIMLESVNPLHDPSESEWRECYLMLQGTMLSFYQSKDKGRGKLLRSYTLQHAEIGLAQDSKHSVLVPQTRFARMIPSSARRKAWQKDPDLFKQVHQHLLRVRLETDQILLADASEDVIHEWIYAIAAGIDIAQAIDERAAPRQCTVPRRRRRQRNTGDITDPTLVAEQERILRDMYPDFAAQVDAARPGLERAVTSMTTDTIPPATPGREEDELDLAAIREDATPTASPPTTRPELTRNMTSTSIVPTTSSSTGPTTYTTDMIHASATSNFDPITSKWQPPHARTLQQIQRYNRRCLPILLADAIRASDVLITNGHRVKINWRMQMLEEWELAPPKYSSHRFNIEDGSESDSIGDLALERTRSCSQNSAAGSSTGQRDSRTMIGASTSDLGGEDEITRVEEGMNGLEVSKGGSLAKATVPIAPAVTAKTAVTRRPEHDVHGVVFCF